MFSNERPTPLKDIVGEDKNLGRAYDFSFP